MFDSPEARDHHLVVNAEHYTLIYARLRRTDPLYRQDSSSWKALGDRAFQIMEVDPDARLLVYAVRGYEQAYILTVYPKDTDVSKLYKSPSAVVYGTHEWPDDPAQHLKDWGWLKKK